MDSEAQFYMLMLKRERVTHLELTIHYDAEQSTYSEQDSWRKQMSCCP